MSDKIKIYVIHELT